MNSRERGLDRLRGLSSKHKEDSERMSIMAMRFEDLKDSPSTRAVSSFNLFQTPELIADRLASMLSLSGRVLEPSAGLGRLYRAVRYRSQCQVTLVEQSEVCCAELFRETEHDGECVLIQDDFLQCDEKRLGGLFDEVIMNPPFKMGTDIKHIRHALSLLKDGGKLVSLCYNGSRQNSQLRPIADEWIELPAKSFKSEGTNADVVIVVINK